MPFNKVLKRKNRFKKCTKFISRFALLCFLLAVAAAFMGSDIIVGQLFLYETMPDYSIFLRRESREEQQTSSYARDIAADISVTEFFISGGQPGEEDTDIPHIVGLENVVFQCDATSGEITEDHFMQNIIRLTHLRDTLDFNYLMRNFYIVQPETGICESSFDIQHMLTADFSLSSGNIDQPQVLIFNTHSNEMFIDSKDRSEGVKALSIRLCQILNEKYGIRAVYTTGAFDTVNGRPQVLGSYERMEPVISRILQENPSIEVVIDLHRDGVPADRHLVTTLNGKPTAQLMFVNGMSMVNDRGNPVTVGHLPNPNLRDNLAFSFQMQLAAQELFPDSNLMRRIYLKPFRYSLHMLPRSLLVEVGAQTNTLEEALNALYPLASMLATVLGQQ